MIQKIDHRANHRQQQKSAQQQDQKPLQNLKHQNGTMPRERKYILATQTLPQYRLTSAAVTGTTHFGIRTIGIRTICSPIVALR